MGGGEFPRSDPCMGVCDLSEWMCPMNPIALLICHLGDFSLHLPSFVDTCTLVWV